MTTLPSVHIFTDGACRGNPGPGGWGALLQWPDRTETPLHGGEADTTNNRMELTAAIEALNYLPTAHQVSLTTDSQYVRQGITQWIHNWQKRNWRNSQNKPVKNKDLWQALIQACERHDLQWHWVKGHSGHPGNERADALANQGIDELCTH